MLPPGNEASDPGSPSSPPGDEADPIPSPAPPATAHAKINLTESPQIHSLP
ncbi:hypothetical protein LV75_002424, partial [Actinokineospora diospyrosa]|nr:hypothetical protein [Actinokineospora diospyrosa]